MSWQYSIFNSEDQDTCLGQMQLTIKSGDILLHESLSVMNGDVDTEYKQIPDTLALGSPIKIEAWCLDETDQELSYFLFESPLKGGKNAMSIVLSDPINTDGYDCLVPTEFRGAKLCVRSKLFDG